MIPGVSKVIPMLTVAETSLASRGDGLSQGRQDPFCQLDRVLAVPDVLDENGELVSTESGRGVNLSETAHKDL